VGDPIAALTAAHWAERWDGAGAVRLLQRSDGGCAILIERCEPGTW
jgi:streptomycin 6-kinase